MDLTDSIAEPVAEAGNPGYSLVHPGHGALESGLSAEEDIGHSWSFLIPSRPAGSGAEDSSVLSWYMSGECGGRGEAVK